MRYLSLRRERIQDILDAQSRQEAYYDLTREYSLLLACYHSGQMSERQWQDTLTERPALQRWLNRGCR